MKPNTSFAHAVIFGTATFVAAIATSSGSIPAEEPAEKELKAFQGTWTVESFTLNGSKLEAEQTKGWRRIIEGKHVTWKNGDQILVEVEITLYPTQKPAALDAKILTGDAKGQTLSGIYELKGDEMRVCFAAPNKPRPTEFESKPESDQSMYAVKRMKP